MVEACLAALMAAVSFFFGASSSWAAMSLSAALFFLFCYAPVCFSGPKPLRVSFAVLMGFLILQAALFSMNRYASSGEILKWLSFALFFCFVVRLPQASVLNLAFVAAVIGIFQVFYGIWEVRSGHEHVLWAAKKNHIGFVTGTYFNRNHLAGFLELCLGLAAGGFMKAFYERSKTVMAGTAAAFFILTAGLFLTGSRMGVISVAAAFAVVLAGLILGKGRKPLMPALWLALGAVPAACWGLKPWLSRWTGLPLLETDGQRFQAWKDTLGIIRDHLLTGIGTGAFEWVFPRYQSADLVMSWNHVHNDYLELAAELGIPGFLIFCAFFILLFRYCLRGLSGEKSAAWFNLGVVMGILAFLIHGLTDFNFSIPANAMLFVFMTAVLFRSGEAA